MTRTGPESAVLGALTKLALWFQFQDRSFSGKEVAEILISAWHSYEQAKPDEPKELKP